MQASKRPFPDGRARAGGKSSAFTTQQDWPAVKPAPGPSAETGWMVGLQRRFYTDPVMRRLAALISQHRRRVARVLFGLGLFAVAYQLLPNVPRHTELEFAL